MGQITAAPRSPHGIKKRPRIFFGWYIVAASVAMNFYLSIAFFQGFQVFFLPILNEFGWSRTLVSGAFSLRQLETGVLAPVIGFLVDRWGPRSIILSGVLIGGAGMVFLSFITSAWMFYAAFLIISLGMSGASHGISWPAIISNWFRRMRGRALGLAFMGPVVGGPFIVTVTFLEGAVGWRMSTLLLGIGVWLVCIPLTLLARARPEPYGYLPDGDGSDSVPAEELAVAGAKEGHHDLPRARFTPSSSGLTWKEAVRTRTFWFLVVIFGAHGLGINGMMVHQIPYFESIGFSAQEAALALGLIFVLSGIGRLGAGTLMDYVDRKLVLAAVLVVQAISYFLLLNIHSLWQLVLFALLFGGGFGSTIPARPIIIHDSFGPRAFGAINGLSQGGAVIMGVLGPLFLGAVFDRTGSYSAAVVALGALTAAVVPLALMMDTPRREFSR